MKKTIVLAAIFYFTNSCKEKERINIKEIISNEIVTITPDLKNSESKDSVSINIPVEFEIETNSSLESVDLYYVINKKVLMQINEFEMFKKENKTKPINNLKPYLSIEKPLRIILREENHLISKYHAQELLKKYHIIQSLENFKLGDTIKIEPYSQFRKSNPIFLNELRKIGDTLIITTRIKDEEIYKSKKIKINW